MPVVVISALVFLIWDTLKVEEKVELSEEGAVEVEGAVVLEGLQGADGSLLVGLLSPAVEGVVEEFDVNRFLMRNLLFCGIK